MIDVLFFSNLFKVSFMGGVSDAFFLEDTILYNLFHYNPEAIWHWAYL